MAIDQLDTRISRLPGLDRKEQVKLGLAIILESANGEAPHVFEHLRGTEAAAELAMRMDPVTGLMQPVYFRQQVADKLLYSRLFFENTTQLAPVTYAIIIPAGIQDVKAQLKTHKNMRTQIIGHLGDFVAAAFMGEKKDVEAVLDDSSIRFYGTAQNATFPSFFELHNKAMRDLLENIRLYGIAKPLFERREPSSVGLYLGLKDKHEKAVYSSDEKL